MSVLERIYKMAEEVTKEYGCYVYDLEFSNKTLRLYIDKKEASINLEDCEKVSRSLNVLLDSEDKLPFLSYTLEVSSPGVNRKLKWDWHFKEMLGEVIQVKTCSPIYYEKEEKKHTVKILEGVLENFKNKCLFLRDTLGRTWEVPLEKVQRANKVVKLFEKTNRKKG